jgi:hypothetical protein
MPPKRWCLILSVVGCAIGQAHQARSADPMTECMETGRGTYMEGRWNLASQAMRLHLCRDQETDRQKADRLMKQWQEEQRRLQRERPPGKAEQQRETKGNEEPSRQPAEPEPAGKPAGEGDLAPCARADVVGECQATPDQILYQIQRSKETGGATNR